MTNPPSRYPSTDGEQVTYRSHITVWRVSERGAGGCAGHERHYLAWLRRSKNRSATSAPFAWRMRSLKAEYRLGKRVERLFQAGSPGGGNDELRCAYTEPEPPIDPADRLARRRVAFSPGNRLGANKCDCHKNRNHRLGQDRQHRRHALGQGRAPG